MKPTLIAAFASVLPMTALAQDAEALVTYDCSINMNCSSGSCVENSPPFEFQLVHDVPESIGTVLFADQAAETIFVSGMGTHEFMQLHDDSSVGFSIRDNSGKLEIRAHGPAGSTLEKGSCKIDS